MEESKTLVVGSGPAAGARTAPVAMTRQEMEARRLRAAKDLARGVRPSVVARTYGVTRTSVSRWRKLVRKRESLALRHATGAPRRIDYKLLEPILSNRSRSFEQLAADIEARFGIKYDPDHVGRIAARLFGQRRARRKADFTTSALAARGPRT